MNPARFSFDNPLKVEDPLQPTTYQLFQNYPNPFNLTTTIAFDIPKRSFVKLVVYNVIGQEVATLVNQEMPAGQHSVIFNAGNLPSGIYIYTLMPKEFI